MSQSDPYHYSDIDPEYLQIYTPLYITTTSVSLLANVTVIGFHWLMTWYKVAEFNRVSLRLIVVASFIGMIRSIVRLSMGVPADTVTCLVDSFFLGWTEIAAPLCLCMVGVHAVCVLVLNVKNPLRLEKYYYMIITLYSLVTSLVTVTHRTMNYPEDFHCWVRFYFGSKARQPFAWTWYFTLLLLPMTLAAFCSLILAIRYRMERHNFVETSVRYAQNNNPYLLPAIPNRRRRVDPIKTFRNLVIRSAFYALVPLITKIFLVISGLTSLRGYSTNFYALMIGGVITNLQGLLISILYFSDPAVTFTLGRLGRFLRRVYVDEYQLPYDKPADDTHQMEIGIYDSDDLRDGDGSEDDIGGAIRLQHDKHDMIAADTNPMEPTHERYRHNRHHYYGRHHQGLSPYYQRVKIDTTRRMQDPYRYRWLAKTIHCFLTFICRLKPLPPTSSSTSTLSYHSRTLSTHTQTNSIASTNSTTSLTDKDHVPAIRFDTTTPEDEQKDDKKSTNNQQLLCIPTQTGTSVSQHDSVPSVYSSEHLVSSSLNSSLSSDAKARGMGKSMASSNLAQQSKKLRQVMLHRPENITSPDISPTPPQQISYHLSPPSSEEDIDRLSLLSYAKSIESSANEQYEPLSAPPHYYQHHRQRGKALRTPRLSITLPDQATSHHQPTPPEQQLGSKHGVALTPAVLKTLLDWGQRNMIYPAYVDQLIMESDGLEYGSTKVTHIQQSWDIAAIHNGSSTLSDRNIISDSISNRNRLVFFVEHWVKGYLGSRWFVVE